MILIIPLLFTPGCVDMDLHNPSAASSGNWYSNETEILMSLNDLYQHGQGWFFEMNRLFHTDRWTDDWNQRETTYPFTAGTITGESADTENAWANLYKGVARANSIIISLDQATDITKTRLEQFEGEARFFRAVYYSYLVFLYGDIPFYTDYLSADESYNVGRTDKNIVLTQIYKDFDRAAELLPVNDNSSIRRVTKGAALAFKARTAIWFLDWEKAAEAAGDCINLDVYSLHPDFGELFLSKTKTSPEMIFALPRSTEYKTTLTSNSFYPRCAGGTATAQPSWELFCSFTCTDGLPIDKSPLFDLQNPFKNRDPRCAYTFVEFGTAHLGFIYDPSPAATQVLNLSTGRLVTNTDSKTNNQYAAYNGMALKKWVDEEWADDKLTEANQIIMRYADVLLMYAEAKMELNEIDASVLNTINQIRARAYKTQVGETSKYPAVTETDQAKLRTIIRTERRVELAWENKRWFDLMRWRLCETALRRPVYALPTKEGLQKNYDNGDYFFPKGVLPSIDENGLVDFSAMYATGKIWAVIPRNFQSRQYLFPIPVKERMVNKSLTQNPEY
jgi:hypothetical protein